MKHILITTIAAVVLLGCSESQTTELPPEPPDISIHRAALDGNIEAVKQHLAAGTDVNKWRSVINDGVIFRGTPLHMAVSEGKKEIAELLIAEGADVNANGKSDGLSIHVKFKNYFGPAQTPLHSVTTKGIAKLLIDKGANVNAKDEWESTPLHYAALEGHMEVAELLIDKGADMSARDSYNRTPLLLATSDNHKDIAELLIAKGSDVNAQDVDGRTILHHAAAGYGRKEIVKLLIAKVADVNTKDQHGKTPLDDVEAQIWEDDSSEDKTAKKETANLIRKHGGKSGAADSIHVAAMVGNVEAVQQHLDSGVDVNIKNKLGRTPMLYAIKRDDKEISELLIAKGAIQVPRIRINDAVRRSNIEAIKQHLAVGTNVDERDYDGESTPLHLAADFGEEDIAELLISGGANVNAKSGSKTPLDHALSLDLRGREPSPSRKAIADLLRKHGGKTAEELKAEGK
jgi:cytohesin